MNQNIPKYIRQNRDTYTREAIDRALVDGGYDPAEIQAAWTAIESEQAIPTPPGEGRVPGQPTSRWGDDTIAEPRRRSVASTGQFWLTLGGFIAASYVVTGFLWWIILQIPYDSRGGFDAMPLAFYGVLQLGALIAGIAFFNRNPPVAYGFLFGLLTVNILLPFVAFFILLGICLYSFSSI
ncbi:MAG TPA: hypothetical protein VEX13_17040 [Chloroflexia bacterium]|nr:hypothetical protein [Chloroflexia bacterium]